ncbi:uncharacterized protein (UPF0276 family) [Methylopila capsulata]|uniref:UPF0276 protein GCM10008170_29990 n=1 Tax=Methylopila capsulata TaxID=61654 RepID=A0A9W6MSP4_9HYPH|nr:DUF692 domain-containing protein [Methylopila capsulata]MBM7852770.1 uncharacterized protein (UPF0276 family) [Methylopila capsulata]GLK56980.1 UPF0276 protein [Methylopila capsulata]
MIPTTLPATAGVGFKPEHFTDALADADFAGFFEVHAENYMGAGGPPHAQLGRLRLDHALSIHGVGLSIGGAGPLDREHLSRLKLVCDRYRPESFSEHLAWSTHDGVFLNDLLPLPYTAATLARVVAHVDETQSALGRRLLLENPATYVLFVKSEIPEAAFLAEVARRTGCGLLLDINNVLVSATNHGTSPEAYLDAFPLGAVGEIHLAGHDLAEDDGGAPLLIDAHGAPVADPVWALYARTLERTGPLPTLIERDNDVPAWSELRAEAMVAQAWLDRAARSAPRGGADAKRSEIAA